MQTSLSVQTINSTTGKKSSNTINYVNPELTNSKALLLAQKLAALSSDTYNATTRIDKTSLDATTKTQHANPTFSGYSDDITQPITRPYTNIGTSDGNPVGFNYRDTGLTTIARAGKIIPMLNIIFDEDNTYTDAVWASSNFQKNNSDAFYTISLKLNQRTTGTLKFTIHFDATADLEAYDLPITINYVEEE